MADETPILFYDGDCGLCARSVRWILNRDRRGVVRFAPLQGETYRGVAIAGKPTDLSTMTLLENGRLLTRSDAWVRVLRLMGGVWAAVGGVAGLMPRAFRDAAYGAVSRRRRRLFGGADACSVPTPAERRRFLP